MKDDESPDSGKYIHANSNLIGFVNGKGNDWLTYWDNGGNQSNKGSLKVGGKITTPELCIGTDCKTSWPNGGGTSLYSGNRFWIAGNLCPNGMFLVGSE